MHTHEVIGNVPASFGTDMGESTTRRRRFAPSRPPTSKTSCVRFTPHHSRLDMFDISTGTITYKEVILRKRQAREAFLATDVGTNAQLMVGNQDWITYRFSSDQKVFFVAQFKNNEIEQVHIAFALSGNDPKPWTVESETARKSLHDQMLREEIGVPPYQFVWGRIESVRDPRNDAAQIIVTYV